MSEDRSQIAHIEVYEDGEYVIAHDRITPEYTLEDIREDYSGASVSTGCGCRIDEAAL